MASAPHHAIFISYRRGADEAIAGRLYDRLSAHFGRDAVFIDLEGIPLGARFADFIKARIAEAHVVVVVIGPGWVAAAERLSDPADFVRLELAAAFARSELPVIPVAFPGAHHWPQLKLPDGLAALASANGLTIPTGEFVLVVDHRLIPELERLLAGMRSKTPAKPPRASWTRWKIPLGLAGLAAIAALALLLLPELGEEEKNGHVRQDEPPTVRATPTNRGGQSGALPLTVETLSGTWACSAHGANITGSYSGQFDVTYSTDGSYALNGWYEGEFWGSSLQRTDYVERGTYSIDGAIALRPSHQAPSLGLEPYLVRVMHLDQRTSRARNDQLGLSYRCERRSP